MRTDIHMSVQVERIPFGLGRVVFLVVSLDRGVCSIQVYAVVFG